MPLDIQINSLIFSFTFGIFFSLFLSINYKIIYSSKKIIKFIGTALVVFSSAFLYFIILLNINNAIFHPYEIIMIILGFYIENYIHKKIKKQTWLLILTSNFFVNNLSNNESPIVKECEKCYTFTRK